LAAKIAWVSRHPPLPAQLDALRERGFKDIVRISETFTNADEVAAEIRSAGCRHAVVVLPLSMIAQLVERQRDIAWIWAEMSPVEAGHECLGEECPFYDPNQDALIPSREEGYRHLRFADYKRILRVTIVFVDWR